MVSDVGVIEVVDLGVAASLIVGNAPVMTIVFAVLWYTLGLI